MWSRLLAYIGVAAMAAASPSHTAHAFQDPLEVPAMRSELAARSPLIAVDRAGERVVATGIRGHVVYSSDGGQVWTQASVPVSNDLVELSFPTADDGWAVGHNGVVLHTSDGGATWSKQLDGAEAAHIAERYYKGRDAPEDGDRYLRSLEELGSFGASRAFLGVYFENKNLGFVVGTFNRIFRTTDGGATWTPWMHRTENPRELHFYSIRGDGDTIWLTGEQGMVWRLDAHGDKFEARPVDYNGTLFGSVSAGPDLFVFGMRGSIFRTNDSGVSWRRLSVPTKAGITGAVALDDGRLVFVTQGGVILSSTDRGETFDVVRPAKPMSYFAVCAAGGGKLAVVGADGIRVVDFPRKTDVAKTGLE